jgi:DNA-binding HxlR family transcriptional regulator
VDKTFSCGLDAAIDVVGGKWKPLVLWALAVAPRRFGELRREVGGVSEKKAVATLQSLGQQLSEIDPESTQDRWVYETQGVTYRQHWEEKGQQQMEEDLRRGDITFVLYEGYTDLKIPEDVRERLVVRPNFFHRKL